MHKKIKLSSGSTLITAKRQGTSAVTVMVLVPVGSRYEQNNNNGISHFIEHMMFKGTFKRPTSLDVTRELDSIGAEFNAFTSKDHTGYYIKAPADKVELLFDILSDMIFNSRFDEAELEKERGVIIEEINMYEDNPLMYIENLFEQLVFQNHELGWLISGSTKLIKKIKRQQLIDYLQTHYLPKNICISVAGNLQEKNIKRLAIKYFNQRNKKTGLPKYKRYFGKQKNPRLNLYYKTTQQVQLCLGFPAYSYFHKDIFALRLLAVILGGNMSSRLFTEVREKHGLAYFVKAQTSTYQDTGALVIQAGLDKNRIEEAIKVILQELKKIRELGVLNKELKVAKNFLKGRVILNMEDSENVASWYGRQEILIAKTLEFKQYLEKINKVKNNDILRVAQDIVKTQKLNLVLIGPFKDKAKFKKLLRI